MKKIIFKIGILAIITFLIVLLLRKSSVDYFSKSLVFVNISFILFGFVLASVSFVYSAVINIINFINQDETKIKKTNNVVVVSNEYFKELKLNTLTLLSLSIFQIILYFLGIFATVSNLWLFVLTFLFLFSFLITIFIAFDTTSSIFSIISTSIFINNTGEKYEDS
ncbi:hypothetical protein KHQ88_01205 [Mycoplasmatota bacterium]|nr:hypothetical protein KHQ88_01205 [Mycoplasmatota bacterium]